MTRDEFYAALPQALGILSQLREVAAVEDPILTAALDVALHAMAAFMVTGKMKERRERNEAIEGSD